MEVFIYVTAEQLNEIKDDLINGNTRTLQGSYTDGDSEIETVYVNLIPDWMNDDATES